MTASTQQRQVLRDKSASVSITQMNVATIFMPLSIVKLDAITMVTGGCRNDAKMSSDVNICERSL